MKADYGKSKQHKEDYYKFIDDFIVKIESIFGKDINLHNQNIYLRYDSYTINHDHNGYIVNTPYTIKDDGKIIMYKKNHPFFHKNVLYYTNYKLQMDIFYDAETKLLLGYKEKAKDFQLSKRKNIYIRINLSVMNRLKLLGYPEKFIDIVSKMKEYVELYKDPETALKIIISEISRNRIQNLKQCISNLQRYIFRMAYDYETKPIDPETNPLQFLDIYKNKLMTMKLRNDKTKFLKGWKHVKNELFFEEILNKTLNIDVDTKILSTEEISRYDYIGNLILFYIVHEMSKLIDLNNDKFIKESVSYLLLDIIVQLYNVFDEEKDKTNTEIKRFKYALEIYDQREIDEIGGEVEGFYGEYSNQENIDAEITQEVQDALDDAEGENENFDMETPDEYDNVDYASGINYNM